MRVDAASRYGPRSTQVVSLSTAESELFAAAKTASEGLGIQSVAKVLADSLWAEPTSGCLSDGVLGQSQRIGQGETRGHAKPVDTGGIQFEKIRHEECRHEREPRRLDDEADAKTEDRAAYEYYGLRS